MSSDRWWCKTDRGCIFVAIFFIFWFVCFVFCALTCTHTQAQRRYQTVWNGDGRGVRGEQRVLMPGCFYENNLWCLATSKQFPFAGVWPKRGELRASTHKVSGMEYLKPPHKVSGCERLMWRGEHLALLAVGGYKNKKSICKEEKE